MTYCACSLDPGSRVLLRTAWYLYAKLLSSANDVVFRFQPELPFPAIRRSWHSPTSLNPQQGGVTNKFSSHLPKLGSRKIKREIFFLSLQLPFLPFSSSSLSLSKPSEVGTSQPEYFTTKSIKSSIFFASFPPLAPRAASSAALGHVPSTHFGLAFFVQRRNYAKSRKMPPKKQVVEEKIPLGRPGNNLKSGIVRDNILSMMYATC